MSAVFCFKQKTAYEMRISDWSSDVCSSDLAAAILLEGADGELEGEFAAVLAAATHLAADADDALLAGLQVMLQIAVMLAVIRLRHQHGDVAADRKSTRLNSSH